MGVGMGPRMTQPGNNSGLSWIFMDFLTNGNINTKQQQVVRIICAIRLSLGFTVDLSIGGHSGERFYHDVPSECTYMQTAQR
jgi:hypothetical protein